eukprot:COSAG01_NODE_1949_length_8821_cov_10.456317_5_plen_41_part_00
MSQGQQTRAVKDIANGTFKALMCLQHDNRGGQDGEGELSW